MRLLLVVVALLGCAVAEKVEKFEVYVRPNGVFLREAPTSYFADSVDDLRKQVHKAFGKQLGGKSWWLADSQGLAVTSTKALAALPLAERQLSVVPATRRFQWSPGKVGERMPVKLENWEGLELEPIAYSPRIFLMHNLFSEEEANFLIDRAVSLEGSNALMSSAVGYAQGQAGKRNTASKRTSSSAFDKESETSLRLIRRAFEALRVPFHDDMADGLQILRYNEGQAYIPHTDWFPVRGKQDAENFDTTQAEGINRLATVFLYLHPPPSGGYTVFPQATIEEGLLDGISVSGGKDEVARDKAVAHAQKFYNGTGADGSGWEVHLTRDCYSKLSVKPVRLGAALFYHQEPMTGKLLQEAVHGACPSLTGTKWGANLWIWNNPRTSTGRAPPQTRPPRSWQGAPQGAASDPRIPHGKPGPEIPVQFENRERTDVLIEYSVDQGAIWSYLDRMPPAPAPLYPMKTFAGHMWRIKDQSGKVLTTFKVPEKVDGALVVSSDGSTSKGRTDL